MFVPPLYFGNISIELQRYLIPFLHYLGLNFIFFFLEKIF